MQRTGGIIALVAGVFAFFASICTFVAGFAPALLDAESAAFRTWDAALYGFVCAVLVIVWSALMMNRTERLPSVLVLITSVIGAIVGGPIVAICMVLAFIGGLVGVLDGSRRTT
jgi:hypothetical protein